MKAIKINYLSPTNTKGARVKATDGENSYIEPRDYSLDYQDQALNCAESFIKKMEWKNCQISGIGCFKNDYYATIEGV